MSFERFEIDESNGTPIDGEIRGGLAQEAGLAGSPSTEDQVMLSRHGAAERAARRFHKPTHSLISRSCRLLNEPFERSYVS